MRYAWNNGQPINAVFDDCITDAIAALAPVLPEEAKEWINWLEYEAEAIDRPSDREVVDKFHSVADLIERLTRDVQCKQQHMDLDDKEINHLRQRIEELEEENEDLRDCL